jgi:serine phosphatase RsbU (regulator of sigma subunit)
VLQRGLLPSGEAVIPGVETSVVYEPAGEGSWAGGDFYDFFEVGDGRWRFALGDVCGNGPEAAVVTGLARPVLRLLAREGYSVPEVMDRLNREVGEQTRFLSLVYGELVPRPAAEGGGSECTLVCAGHPLPLVRLASGEVRAPAEPQLLLGVVDDVRYESQSVTLKPGETLLCVTDGVTERRSGARLFDDGDGLAAVFAECGGLDAAGTAERVRRAVHDFGDGAPGDDLALVVLQARDPESGQLHSGRDAGSPEG